MKRCFAALLSCVVAVPLFARVISYAPYTNRIATPAFQERTTRHFALIESTIEERQNGMPNEVVLYDSTGLEEPRVIAPKSGIIYDAVALYQKPGGTPLVLIIGRDTTQGYAQKIAVIDNGQTWSEVKNVGAFFVSANFDVDTGGPYVSGLYTPVIPGNDTWPFIVTLGGNGVWAIGPNGTARRMSTAPSSRVIGRNRAGDRFLIHNADQLWSTTVEGPVTQLATVDSSSLYAGWLRANGTAYVQILQQTRRTLYEVSNGSLRLIAGAPSVNGRFFAVPTHDFEGAWMIQRQDGLPTKMLRHDTSSGLQTMWSDVTAPQVEALISGPSGSSVLVQVHRERDGAELERPFIDPALAVWRTGQPAPRSYEELYLNENWNKGFVHVDVEEIEAGKPFVFNSGFEEQAPPSRVSPPIAGGGDVVQEWGVVRASFKQRLVVPGVARLPGAFNSFWLTDLTLYNPLDAPQDVEVRFMPLGTTEIITTTITLAAEEIRAVPDALKTLFSLETGGGTLHFLPAVGINATSRTYSRNANGGTFGFGMQAIDFYNAAGPRFPLSFAGAFPGEHFRTNLLLTDTSGRGAHAMLRGSRVTGAVDSNAALAVPADGTVQLNSLAPAVGLLSSDGGGLVVEPTRGTAIATIVAIDNRTNDATYFPPDLPASVVRAIPVIGHLDGANGSKFRSDVYLHNPTDRTSTVSMTAKKWDSPEQKTITFTLLPRESRVVPDALKTLFGMEGLARLRYSTPPWEPGDGVRLTSRTYTVEPSGATYGCLVPPLNAFQIGMSGDRLEILGISGGTGFRTNIGLVDLSENSPTNPSVRVTIVDNTRRVIDSFSVQVPARGGMQINDIFTARGVPPPPAAMVIVEVLDGRQVGAYATLTDNITNDSTYLGAQLGAQPNGN